MPSIPCHVQQQIYSHVSRNTLSWPLLPPLPTIHFPSQKNFLKKLPWLWSSIRINIFPHYFPERTLNHIEVISDLYKFNGQFSVFILPICSIWNNWLCSACEYFSSLQVYYILLLHSASSTWPLNLRISQRLILGYPLFSISIWRSKKEKPIAEYN